MHAHPTSMVIRIFQAETRVLFRVPILHCLPLSAMELDESLVSLHYVARPYEGE